MKNDEGFYRLREREVRRKGKWDVVVVGGGPAGSAAAMAAGREGKKVLLVERSGCLGGMGTIGLVPAWTPFSDKKGGIIYSGIAERIFKRCKEGMKGVVGEGDLDWVGIDAEWLKAVYDEEVSGMGVEVLFNAMLLGAEVDGEGKVERILIGEKAGLSVVEGTVFVDATGDADLVGFAGGKFLEKGREEMPASHCFVLTNVREEVVEKGPKMHGELASSPIHRILDSGKYPLIPDAHFCVTRVGRGTYGFNAGHIWGLDVADGRRMSEALMLGRRMARQYRDALAEFYPEAFGEAFLVNTGAFMGVRESRRIEGDYVLKLDDYLERRRFEDEVAVNNYFLDVHSARKDMARTPEEWEKWHKKLFHYGPGEVHGIPYRALLPVGLRNVIVAGRTISCEQVVQGSVRVMPTCLMMGEGAGKAAARAAELGGDVRKAGR